MDINNTVQLIIAASTKIDTLWQIFIHVHVAVFAFVFIYSDKFDGTPPVWKGLSLVAYLMFLALNYLSLSGSYIFLDALHDQLRGLDDGASRLGEIAGTAYWHPKLANTWLTADYSDRAMVLIGTHTFALLSVTAAVCIPKSKGEDAAQPSVQAPGQPKHPAQLKADGSLAPGAALPSLNGSHHRSAPPHAPPHTSPTPHATPHASSHTTATAWLSHDQGRWGRR